MYWSRFTTGRIRLWQKLREQKPEDVCRRTQAKPGPGGYLLQFLCREVAVSLADGRIGGELADPLLEDQELELLLLTYLTQAEETPPSNAWITEKDLPGGSLFFRGPHALPVQPLVRRFGTDREAFRKAAVGLGGTPLEFGDASFGFRVLPRLPAAGILWLGDEEFPARFTMMFDRTTDHHLPLDVVLALAHCLGQTLLAQAGPPG
jgi:hypothetical protein